MEEGVVYQWGIGKMKRGANIKCTAVADMTCPMESCCHMVVDTNFRVYVDMACHMESCNPTFVLYVAFTRQELQNWRYAFKIGGGQTMTQIPATMTKRCCRGVHPSGQRSPTTPIRLAS